MDSLSVFEFHSLVTEGISEPNRTRIKHPSEMYENYYNPYFHDRDSKNPTIAEVTYGRGVNDDSSETGSTDDNLTFTSSSENPKYLDNNADDGTKASDHYLSGIKLYLTIFSALISLFISALDLTIIITIFESVGNEFDGFDKISWLTSAFLIPMAILVPSHGKISIAFGRKLTLLACVFIFEVGSLVCALANSMNMLIAGRVIQGIGAGGIQVNVAMIITETVPISRRSISIALIAVAYSVACAIGPIIGSLFTEKVTWRWCFYINLPFGFVAGVSLLLSYNPPRPKGKLLARLKCIDYFGSVLLTAGLLLLMVGLSVGGNQYEWVSAPVLLMLVLGVMILVSYFMYNFILSKYPMFLKEFFLIPQIACAGFTGFFNYAFFLANITYITVYFQVVLRHSTLQSGIDLMPLIVTVAVAAVINGILARITRNVKIFYVFSSVCGVVGCCMLLLLERDSNLSQRIGYLIIMGISVGVQVQCTLFACQLKAPLEVPGSVLLVTVFANFNRFFGGAFGATIGSAIFNSLAEDSITEIMEKLPLDIKKELAKVSPRQFLSTPKYIQTLPADTQDEIMDALMVAIKAVFKLGIGFSCAALVLTIFTTNKRIPKHSDLLVESEEKEEVKA